MLYQLSYCGLVKFYFAKLQIILVSGAICQLNFCLVEQNFAHCGLGNIWHDARHHRRCCAVVAGACRGLHVYLHRAHDKCVVILRDFILGEQIEQIAAHAAEVIAVGGGVVGGIE